MLDATNSNVYHSMSHIWFQYWYLFQDNYMNDCQIWYYKSIHEGHAPIAILFVLGQIGFLKIVIRP
jgi:hypothetical protein